MAEGIQRAGEWELLECKLLTSTGLTHNLLPHMLGVTLYEDMYKPCISGTLMFHNSLSLSNIAPIIGQEFISIKFATPTMHDDNAKLDFTENVFHTRGIAKREVLDESEFIALDFVSTELMRNFRIRVSEAFDGSVSSIVSKMLKRVKCEKDRYIEPTNGRIRYLAPNLTPFGVIQKVLSRAVSGTSSQKSPSPVFGFWESTKGMHFRTIDSCIAQQPRWRYTNIDMDRDGNKGQPSVFDGLSAIRGLALKTNDSMADLATGVLNSSLITHNTHTKSFIKTEYNYLDAFANEQHIGDGHPLYNTSGHAIEDKGKGRISDGTGKIFLSSTVEEENTFFDPSYTDTSGNYSFVGYQPYSWLQRQHSQRHQLSEAIKVNITVMGNTVVSAGDIVTVDLPKRQIDKVQGEKEKFDTFVQGDFLVKEIKHKFIVGQDHTMVIELVRDSVAVAYDGIETSIEPRPANTGHEFNDIYVIET